MLWFGTAGFYLVILRGPIEMPIMQDAKTPPEGFRFLDIQGPYDKALGTLYFRRGEKGFTVGFFVEERHCNPNRILHGGVVATVADISMGISSRLPTQGRAKVVTASLAIDYIGSAVVGDWVEARSELVNLGRRLIIVQCDFWKDGRRIVRANSTFAPIGEREVAPDPYLYRD